MPFTRGRLPKPLPALSSLRAVSCPRKTWRSTDPNGSPRFPLITGDMMYGNYPQTGRELLPCRCCKSWRDMIFPKLNLGVRNTCTSLLKPRNSPLRIVQNITPTWTLPGYPLRSFYRTGMPICAADSSPRRQGNILPGKSALARPFT